MKKRHITLLAILMATMTACSFEKTAGEDAGQKIETTENVESGKDADSKSDVISESGSEAGQDADSKNAESKSSKSKNSMAIRTPLELTLEKVQEITNITYLLKNYGPFRYSVTRVADGQEAAVTEGIYTINDTGLIEISATMYAAFNGENIMYYMNTDANDPYYYQTNDIRAMRYEKAGEMENFANLSFADVGADEYKIVSTREENGLYVVEMECYYFDVKLLTIEMSFDPETGCIQSYSRRFFGNTGNTMQEDIYKFEFDDSLKADLTAKEHYENSDQKEIGTLVFDTVDINGNPVTNDIIKGSKVILMNLWEPWCGPCVKELSELEKLYETYKDRGLLILGVYSDSENAKEIVEDAGVTYPILQADANLYAYEQSYVPATFLFDKDGNLLETEPIEGSRTYEGWEEIVLEYLPQ